MAKTESKTKNAGEKSAGVVKTDAKKGKGAPEKKGKKSVVGSKKQKSPADLTAGSATTSLEVKKELPNRAGQKAKVISSKKSYAGPLFNVFTEQVEEPGGKPVRRDIIRHNGSIVILAIDSSKSKKDPLIILEQQYRHAAGQYLVELPAGKLETGEDPLEGAKRELIEETGFRARKWSELVRYFASPGFLGEWMQVFLAEDLTLGEATPEEDESIDVAAIPLSKVLKMIGKGKVLDGKTLISVLTYDRMRKGK
jgi:ADP-ribose pyrophosphatase